MQSIDAHLSTKALKKLKTSTAIMLASVAVLAGCSGPSDATEEDLANALQQDDAFSTSEADCVAEAINSKYGDDQDTLNQIAYSDAEAFDNIETGDDAIEGFNDFYDKTLEDCANLS